MCDFFKWLVSPDNINANIFGMITVLLSGFVSWLISALYFRKGNRNALRLNVIFPIKRTLEEPLSWKNFKVLEDLSKAYDAKYFTKHEQALLNQFLLTYKSICTYSYSSVCAESLFSYFCYKLQQNGIDTKPVPIYVDDEIVDFEEPIDLLYLQDDLAKVIDNRPPEYEEDTILTDEVKSLFKFYCKKYFSDREITYFDDLTLDEVLQKARARHEWNQKLENYKKVKQKFIQLRVFNK